MAPTDEKPAEASPSVAMTSNNEKAVDIPADAASQTTPEPPKKKGRQAFLFLQLLFRSDPTALDLTLIIVGTIAAAAGGVPYPLIGILFGKLIDDFNAASCAAQSLAPDTDPFALQQSINNTVVQIVCIASAQFVLIYIYAACWNVQSQRLAHRLRDRHLRALLRQPLAFFDADSAAAAAEKAKAEQEDAPASQAKAPGELAARLGEDFTAIQTATGDKIGRAIGQTAFFIAAYAVAFAKLPVLAGILVSLVPAFLLMSFFGSRLFKKYSSRASDGAAAASSVAGEALAHVAVVQAFGAAKKLEGLFAGKMAGARTAGIRKALVAAVQAGLLYFIAYSSNALAYWLGSRMISSEVRNLEAGGTASVGNIYTVVFLVVDACIIMGSMAPLFPIFGAASAAYERVKKDLETKPEIDSLSEDGTRLTWDTPGAIEFRDVSFAYPSRPGQLALKNVGLHFPAGKHTALVGLSGSGKSTVVGLLNRLYDPNAGTVLFDGQDAKDVNVRNLRGFIGMVQQEAPLLDRSVLENIALGLVNSPRPEHEHLRPALLSGELEEMVAEHGKDVMDVAARQGGAIAEIAAAVQRAADQAQLAFVDRLELGFSTQVGEGGKLVSGGQRQRIALARTLARDPKIFVLDEATAALDSTTERKIQAAIDAAAVGRTVVSVAHRLSTIKHADNIVVMRDGEVVEQGTYADLVEKKGAFAHLVQLQGIDQNDGPSLSRSGSLSGSMTEVESIASEAVPQDTLKTEATLGATDPIAVKEKDETDPAKEATPEAETPPASGWAVIRGMHFLIRPDFSWLSLALFTGVIVGATFTASALILGNTISAFNPCTTTPSQILANGYLFGGLLFMLAVVELAANAGSWSSFGRIAENLLFRTRILAFRSLMEQPVNWHQSGGRSPAALLGVITKDGASLGAFSGSIIGTAFSIVVNFLIAVIVSHIFAWKLALVSLAVVPILLGAGILQVRAVGKYEAKNHSSMTKVVAITVEAVGQIKTVASLSLEDEVVGSYRRALKGPKKEILKEALHTGIYFSISNSTGFFIYGLSYWFGSGLIMKGEITQTQFFVVQISMLVSAQLWGHMFSLAPEFSRAKAAASRMMDLVNKGATRDVVIPKEIKEKKGAESGSVSDTDVEATARSATNTAITPHPRGGASIVFSNVSFAYPARPSRPILSSMSFHVTPGQFIGLVGPSGAGKSTIMSLIQRIYAPTSGSITIDGLNINSTADTAFRDDMAVVPQDSAMFNGTVAFNVGLGARPCDVATRAEIEEACKLAHIHDTIVGLPQGYDTEVGPGGSRLSGGQRQRLAVARALVRRPRVLLLDESTSALDAESEAALEAGLEKVAREMGTTVVAITHRLRTVRRADLIMVVEAGSIMEKGTHGELMARSERYRVNAMQQMLQ